MVSVETLGCGWIIKIYILISELWLEYEFGSLLLYDNLGLLIIGYKIWFTPCKLSTRGSEVYEVIA
jgi:hypothetical protein